MTKTFTRPQTLKDMAVELYQRGKYDKAAHHARKALEGQDSLTFQATIHWTMLLSMCERAQGRDEESLRIQLEISPLVESLSDDVREEVFLKAKYHNGLAITYKKLKRYDKAFEEYTAAAIYHEMAGEREARAEIESNLANLLIEAGQPGKAHEYIDRALADCSDPATIGQMEDVQARAFHAQNEPRAALLKAATSVLRLLATENEKALDDSVATLATLATYWPQMREAERIKKALIDAGGHVETAAKLLGYKNRQTLENKLNRKYKFLETYRTPPRTRNKRQ